MHLWFFSLIPFLTIALCCNEVQQSHLLIKVKSITVIEYIFENDLLYCMVFYGEESGGNLTNPWDAKHTHTIWFLSHFYNL